MRAVLILWVLTGHLVLIAQTQTDTISLPQEVPTDSTIVPGPQNNFTIDFKGHISSWEITQFSSPINGQWGARFVPTVLGNFQMDQNSALAFEASAHLNGNINYTGWRLGDKKGQLQPYRVWLRYATANWELRAGLQKINFGPAKIFRPLMWFDGMDMRDPLKLTNGVYGILGKYFFKNNANIWLWSLIGNKKAKGWELAGSAPLRPEMGGRVEVPALGGEMAMSAHLRKMALNSLADTIPKTNLLKESRIGLDGRWDLGVGLWFESSITRLQKNNYSLPVYQDLWNIGADYTVAVGNGIGFTAEYFRYHFSDKFLARGKGINLAATLFTYPVSILDNLTAMVFFEASQRLWFNYISWNRTYDKWNLYLIGFWNPVMELPVNTALQGKNLFAGKGFQLMASYDF